MQRVEDVWDLKYCTDGVQTALQDEDYEKVRELNVRGSTAPQNEDHEKVRRLNVGGSCSPTERGL